MRAFLITTVIYTAIFLAVGAAIYFFAFWRPNVSRVEQLRREIDGARIELVMAAQRDEARPQLQYDIERLDDELNHAQSDWDRISNVWLNEYLRFMPDIFSDADTMERVYHIIAPHAHNLHIDLLYSQPLSEMNHDEANQNGLAEGVWLTPANISFVTGYDGLMAILNGFAHQEIDNRIVEYTLTRQGDQWQVAMRLDVLTQMTPPHRNNGGYIVEAHG